MACDCCVLCADIIGCYLQRQLAAQMLHQQQLLQRAAAQHAQQGTQQETVPNVWRPAQGFGANAPAANAAQFQQHQGLQQLPPDQQLPGQDQQ